MSIYTRIVDQTKERIRQELEEIDCRKVAQYCGYSVKQINRIFMASTQMSIGSYIHSKKMAQAIMELRYTDFNILEIALRNGFSTQESFSRAFKKEFHLTPNQFRKRHALNDQAMENNLLEVVEETSHEYARQGKMELPNPRIQFVHKPQTLWYSIGRNTMNQFPHNFYVACTKKHWYEMLYEKKAKDQVGGAYLTHIYKGEKFSSLTLGYEEEYSEECLKERLKESRETYQKECQRTQKNQSNLIVTIMPESDYLVVNVPPYKQFELGAHVLAAWEVFSEFDYQAYQLERNLDQAPIYEWDSLADGYTLYFPVRKIVQEDEHET